MSEKFIKLLLWFTLIFNVVDACASVALISFGGIEEVNLLMDTALRWGVIPFVMTKTALVAGGTYILWKYRYMPIAQVGAYAAFMMYWTLTWQFWAGGVHALTGGNCGCF